MTSLVIKSSGRDTIPIVFLESSKARVNVTKNNNSNSGERSSLHLEEPQKIKRSFSFNLHKTLSFISRRDHSSCEEIALEGTERNFDRRAWLRIEREKARKELRLDQEGDATETTSTSELTPSLDSTPKHASSSSSPLRTSSYSASIAFHLPAPSVADSPRRREGNKPRRGRRSQLRDIVADEAATKEEGMETLLPRVEVLDLKCHSKQVEASAPSSPDGDSECRIGAPKSPSRRPRRRSLGPVHRERKDVTVVCSSPQVSCETPSRRPRRRSLGPSRRQLLRPLDLTSDDKTPVLNSATRSPKKSSSRERPSSHHQTSHLPEEDEPNRNAQPRHSRRPSSSRLSSRNLLSELPSDELLSPQASPRRRLQTRKVKKMNNFEG